MLMTSCSITRTAKEAAKEWWSENGKQVVTDAADAAKDYWNAKREELLSSSKEFAEKVGEKTLAEATAYIDVKLTSKRNEAVENLVKRGVSFEVLDANGDGTVSDEELDAYAKSNPLALLYGGTALAAWWVVWQVRRRLNISVTKEAAPTAPSAAPPSPPKTGVDATTTKP